MANIETNQVPPTVIVPLGFPNHPAVGKIALLYNANNDSIYNKFTSYMRNDVDKSSFGLRQPFIFTNPNTGTKGIYSATKYDSLSFPIASSAIDTLRVTKFLGSSTGLIFLLKQNVLQTQNTFNETKLYNPLSPIVAAAYPGLLGLLPRPFRNIQLGNGILGAVAGLVGISVGNGVPSAPSGTAGQAALPTTQPTTGTGLLRAKTASTAYNALGQRQGQGSGTSALGFLASIGQSLFGIGYNQPAGTEFRADEGAYGMMLNNQSFNYNITRANSSFIQNWYGGTGGSDGIRKNNQVPQAGTSFLYVGKTNNSSLPLLLTYNTSYTNTVNGNLVGFSLVRNSDGVITYGKNIFSNKTSPLENSEMMLRYVVYNNPANLFSTKFTDNNDQAQKDIISELSALMSDIPSTYIVNPLWALDTVANYNILSNINPATKNSSPSTVVGTYQYNVRNNPQLLSNKGIKSNTPDVVNSLKILSRDTGNQFYYTDPVTGVVTKNVYNPYTSDQIAFYFHDLVNDKYIPFRATVKGINEHYQAEWNDIKYVGRADKIFNYNGFSRELSFNFTVVASSVMEMLPMWKRINYLCGLVKPSAYTSYPYQQSDGNTTISSFIIPPLIAFTIGDMYKEQPAIINSIGLSIPEDASWETLNDQNAQNGWSYLNNYISLPNSKGLYAQFPMVADIDVSVNVLEKEQAQTGRNNFADASDINGNNFSGLLVSSNYNKYTAS